jgi:hypothetical protein
MILQVIQRLIVFGCTEQLRKHAKHAQIKIMTVPFLTPASTTFMGVSTAAALAATIPSTPSGGGEQSKRSNWSNSNIMLSLGVLVTTQTGQLCRVQSRHQIGTISKGNFPGIESILGFDATDQIGTRRF